MGLRGPLPRTDGATRGHPGRRAKGASRVSAEVERDFREVYRRLMAMGDTYFGKVEASASLGRRTAPQAKADEQALSAALKCWHEAQQLAFRIAAATGSSEPRDPLTEHLQGRGKVTRLPATH